MRRVVLVGGGHAHVQVLRGLLMQPLPETEVVLVVDRPTALYSGMAPACVAGEISRSDLEIDVRPLARRAGVRVVPAAVEGLDAQARRIHLHGRPPLRYDVASLNVGSTVRDGQRPDVAAHALPTRPLTALLDGLDARLPALRARGTADVVVVGAGAGGIELAFCLERRLRDEGIRPRVTLVGAEPPAASVPALRRQVAAAAAARGLAVRVGRVGSVEADRVEVGDDWLPSDLTVWVTGAAAHPWLATSGLPVDPRGFVQVGDTLQVVGHDALFAVGDCAVLVDHPWVPRAGVYAVRAGPVLLDNLRRWRAGRTLTTYRPQRDFLSMLNLGDGTAIVSKWGMATRGAWVHRWKDRIDRRFMERFQALGPDGSPRPGVPLAMSGMDETRCGGCAAKVEADGLEEALCALPPVVDPSVTIGLGDRDDVVQVAYGSAQVVANVDGFRAFTDDPWLVGLVGARNALSDLYARGARPRHALAWVTVPEHGASDALAEVMHGVRRALDADGVTLVGGHSTTGDALTVGLVILGEPGGWTLAGARDGDRLVLTRAVGTGVVWRADMAGLVRGEDAMAAMAAMGEGNAALARVLADLPIHATTDVTGFGLAGHTRALARASGLTATLWVDRVPLLPGVAGLLARGVRSTAHDANARLIGVVRHVDEAEAAACHDPQTGGGLLLAVPATAADEVCRRAGAVVIGVLGAFDGVDVHLRRAPGEDHQVMSARSRPFP